jgi:argininosuccinate lyase
MSKSSRSWEHRLKGAPHALSVDFVESLSYDTRLYKYDVAGSIAHAKMLAKSKLITAAELAQIKKGLLEISQEIAAGKFKFDKSLEDIHMAIEAALIKKIGDAGKKLHTARSRNDQVATDIRLWMRDEIQNIQSHITAMQKAFIKLAEKHLKDIMPAYTHMQRAQPVTIAAYLLSFVEKFDRDFQRLRDCRLRLNICPLGSGAIAGTTLPIDRQNTADALGFCGVSANSIDSVSDRDFCAEFIFDCALLSAHLSNLAEDWIIFSTNEFSFVKISDAFCTSSSMMPQKRNPDMLELIRGKSGSVYGALIAMLTILKSQPSGYNRDLQEDKIHVFKAADTATACVEMVAAIVANTHFQAKKIEAGIDEGFVDATALAEYLVKQKVPFRQAHGIVGTLVARCEEENKKLSEMQLTEFQEVSNAIKNDVYDYLSAKNVVKRYQSDGAGGVEQSKDLIAQYKKKLSERK